MPSPRPVRFITMYSSRWPPVGNSVILAASGGLQALMELTVSIELCGLTTVSSAA